MNPLAIGASLVAASAVMMLCTCLYYMCQPTAACRLDGLFAVYCLALGWGQHLLGVTWIECTAYGLAAYFAYRWWTGGGGDDTKRRLGKLRKKFTTVRRTAPATA
jgi:hypothetical protein